MAEYSTPVSVVMVEYQCDVCHKGNMKPTGDMLLTHPPQYPHACDSCGHRETYLERYPTIRYRALPTE